MENSTRADRSVGTSEWTAYLSDRLRLDARIEYDMGEPARYAFQLSGLVDGDWVDLVRHDTAHGVPHRHIYHPDGNSEIVPFGAVPPVTLVGWVQRDIQAHAQGYLDEYLRRRSNLGDR